MEFKVGDKVIRKKAGQVDSWVTYPSSISYDGIYTIESISGSTIWLKERGNTWDTMFFDLVSSDSVNPINENSTLTENMTEKKVFSVLIVNTKTSEVKEETVVAYDTQQGLLKAFNVKDVEDLQISITEKAKFQENKPQVVVMENKGK